MDKPIIDAHLHLNLKDSNPVQSLLQEMERESVEKGVLILNMPGERDAFFQEFSIYQQNIDRLFILLGINAHDESSCKDYEKLVGLGCKAGIKIHPHLFKLDINDIEWYVDYLKKTPNMPVMIDTLYYGAEIEHHIGVEFGVKLARQFSDRHFIMAHSGSLDFLKCMMATRYLDYVYYDYSFIQSFFKNTSLREDMVDFLKRTSFRIMYGSDYPSFKMADCKNDFETLIKDAGISEKQIQDVLYNNALEVYGNL